MASDLESQRGTKRKQMGKIFQWQWKKQGKEKKDWEKIENGRHMKNLITRELNIERHKCKKSPTFKMLWLFLWYIQVF